MQPNHIKALHVTAVSSQPLLETAREGTSQYGFASWRMSSCPLNCCKHFNKADLCMTSDLWPCVNGILQQ